MRLVCIVLGLFVAVSFAQDPDNILIYYDLYGGYGDAVLTACGNLWPSANVDAFQGYPAGQQTQFNDFLDTGTWDIVVIESWYANSDPVDFAGVEDYYTAGGKVFASCWEWTGGTSGQMVLLNAMGVTSLSSFGSPVIPHYVWEATHPIVDGIAGWGWSDPGLGVLNNRFTVGTATPVTGWTNTPTAGQAGICVAPDGFSVVSGFTPAYADEAVAIWENILLFIWEGTGLTPATWGSIKTQF